MAKAVLASPWFMLRAAWAALHLVAERLPAEPFTLTVLLVVLLAARTTHSLGSASPRCLPAGMMLGETEFRHRVESSIRPFRDALLGLFFRRHRHADRARTCPHLALAPLGALLLLSKILVVVLIVRGSVAWRSSLPGGPPCCWRWRRVRLRAARHRPDASVLDPGRPWPDRAQCRFR